MAGISRSRACVAGLVHAAEWIGDGRSPDLLRRMRRGAIATNLTRGDRWPARTTRPRPCSVCSSPSARATSMASLAMMSARCRMARRASCSSGSRSQRLELRRARLPHHAPQTGSSAGSRVGNLREHRTCCSRGAGRTRAPETPTCRGRRRYGPAPARTTRPSSGARCPGRVEGERHARSCQALICSIAWCESGAKHRLSVTFSSTHGRRGEGQHPSRAGRHSPSD